MAFPHSGQSIRAIANTYWGGKNPDNILPVMERLCKVNLGRRCRIQRRRGREMVGDSVLGGLRIRAAQIAELIAEPGGFFVLLAFEGPGEVGVQ